MYYIYIETWIPWSIQGTHSEIIDWIDRKGSLGLGENGDFGLEKYKFGPILDFTTLSCK
jgi:hypothetical protein